MTNQTNNPNAPIETFRISSVRAAIWAKTTDNGVYHQVSITRTYKDENGDYHDVSNFSHLELLAVARVAEQAAGYLESLEKQA